MKDQVENTKEGLFRCKTTFSPKKSRIKLTKVRSIYTGYTTAHNKKEALRSTFYTQT